MHTSHLLPLPNHAGESVMVCVSIRMSPQACTRGRRESPRHARESSSCKLGLSIKRGVTTLTNAVWAILGVNLSRPGNLDYPPEFLEYMKKKFLRCSDFFHYVPELSRVSRKNFQVSRFPKKFLNSRNNFGFVPKQRLLELSVPVKRTDYMLKFTAALLSCNCLK